MELWTPENMENSLVDLTFHLTSRTSEWLFSGCIQQQSDWCSQVGPLTALGAQTCACPVVTTPVQTLVLCRFTEVLIILIICQTVGTQKCCLNLVLLFFPPCSYTCSIFHWLYMTYCCVHLDVFTLIIPTQSNLSPVSQRTSLFTLFMTIIHWLFFSDAVC